ncbi:hypothetical protein P280DRAFT_546577 [Massarina eburnea CBS 473.64]|uniref:RING-type domain-containing protein n=1 Tax=Massarina eburnea CBS 473.64 TaxID=1395130 RepID=A0A6A6S7L4_9PLEO|nr:hypothetical protein P280DRAFT_546577 [Massarina eburnea CBS 473.64]
MNRAAIDRAARIWIQQNTRRAVTDDECSICLETYDTEPARRVIGPACDHIFGGRCLLKILTTNPNEETKCPLCRAVWMAPLGPPTGQAPANVNTRLVNGASANPAVRSAVPPPETTRPPVPINFTFGLPRTDARHVERQRLVIGPRPNAAQGASSRNHVILEHDVIQIDSDSDESDNVGYSIREIAEVRDRASRTGPGHNGRREEAERERVHQAVLAQSQRQNPELANQNRTVTGQVGTFFTRHFPSAGLTTTGSDTTGRETSSNVSTNAPANLGEGGQERATGNVNTDRKIAIATSRLTRTSRRDAVQEPNPAPTTLPSPTLTIRPQNSDSSMDIVENEGFHARSNRVQELENERALAMRNSDKEKHLREYQRKLEEREKIIHEREQRLFVREQRIAQRETRVRQIDQMRERQAEELSLLLSRHGRETR